MKLKKYLKIFTLMILISAMGKGSFAAEEKKETIIKEERFTDVSPKNWYYSTVNDLVKIGGINGYKDGSFKPNKEITFAEFLKAAMSSATGNEYKSKEGEHWAKEVYKSAVDKAIIDLDNFKSDKDSLNAPISREDMAYIAIGINENILKEHYVKTDKTRDRIKDIKDIDEYKLDSVLQAYEKGLIKGKDNAFKAKDKATRAEASTIILRMIDSSKRN